MATFLLPTCDQFTCEHYCVLPVKTILFYLWIQFCYIIRLLQRLIENICLVISVPCSLKTSFFVHFEKSRRIVAAIKDQTIHFQLPVQSMPIITNVVSSSPVHCEVYLIQLYVIKFVSDLRRWFSPGTLVSTNKKTDHHI